jgi:tRNA 2-thiouridine synthesizing protein A
MSSFDHKNEPAGETSIVTLDARGLQCPLPLLRTKQRLNQMNAGDRLLVLATDIGAVRDIPAFCELAGHRVLERSEVSGVYRFLLEKC